MKSLEPTHRASLLSATLVAALGSLGAAGASAAPTVDLTHSTRALTVNFRDVNLATVGGATTLYRRIEGAARFVCGDRGRTIAELRDWQDCYRGAIAGAVATVNSPLLTSIHRSQRAAPGVTALRAP
jgi:UrcA family protein